MYEEYKEKYPHWFDKEGNYVQGSKENQIERIKDKILDADNEMMLFGKMEINKKALQIDLFELQGKDGLLIAKLRKKVEIKEYDKSPSVNSFIIGGHAMWYTHDRRSSMGRAMQAIKASGEPNFEFWDGSGWHIELPIDIAIKAADQLEMYAMQCLIVTNKHLAAVDDLLSVEEVESYNYKTGYPEKLNFDNRGILCVR